MTTPAQWRDTMNFTPRFIQKATSEGWLTFTDDLIKVRTVKGAHIEYRVERTVGRYCCHCGLKLPDDDQSAFPGKAARDHVAAEHAGETSPDRQNLAGYKRQGFYRCARSPGDG